MHRGEWRHNKEDLVWREQLIIEELGDEILVYDTKTSGARLQHGSRAGVTVCPAGIGAQELSANLGLDWTPSAVGSTT